MPTELIIKRLVWPCKNSGNRIARCKGWNFALWFGCFAWCLGRSLGRCRGRCLGGAFARRLNSYRVGGLAGRRDGWSVYRDEHRSATLVLRGVASVFIDNEDGRSSREVASARRIIVGRVRGAPERQLWRCALAVVRHVDGATTRSQERTGVGEVVESIKRSMAGAPVR